MFTRTFFLKRLLRRRPPERISSSSPDYDKRNHIFIRGCADGHIDSLLLAVGKGQVVSYVWWPTDDRFATASSAECDFNDVDWDSLSVTQEYHTWRLEYPSPNQAFLKDLICLPQIRYWIQKFRDRFYLPLTPDKRMKVLSEVIKRHDAEREVRYLDLLIVLYGPSIRLSTDQHQHLERLKFILRSLEATGDVRVRPEVGDPDQNWNRWDLHGDVIPEPKAIATLAKHADSQQRHNDTVRLSRMQFFLGLSMLLVALATLVVRIGSSS